MCRDIEEDTELESEEEKELREEQSADESDQAVDGASPQELPAGLRLLTYAINLLLSEGHCKDEMVYLWL